MVMHMSRAQTKECAPVVVTPSALVLVVNDGAVIHLPFWPDVSQLMPTAVHVSVAHPGRGGEGGEGKGEKS